MKKHAENCLKEPCTCDGKHTFDQLYRHTYVLFVTLLHSFYALSLLLPAPADPFLWISKTDCNGFTPENYFFAGINNKPGEVIACFLEDVYWDELAKFCHKIDKCPPYDGATIEDINQRLRNILNV